MQGIDWCAPLVRISKPCGLSNAGRRTRMKVGAEVSPEINFRILPAKQLISIKAIRIISRDLKFEIVGKVRENAPLFGPKSRAYTKPSGKLGFSRNSYQRLRSSIEGIALRHNMALVTHQLAVGLLDRLKCSPTSIWKGKKAKSHGRDNTDFNLNMSFTQCAAPMDHADLVKMWTFIRHTR